MASSYRHLVADRISRPHPGHVAASSWLKMPAWTAEQIEDLRRSWPQQSASIIAARLNRSRNSIIGKAHRLDLTTPDRVPVPKPHPRHRKPSRPKLYLINMTKPIEPIQEEPPPYDPVSLMDLRFNHCRAIVGV